MGHPHKGKKYRPKPRPKGKHFYGGLSRTGGNRVNRGQSMRAGKKGKR